AESEGVEHRARLGVHRRVVRARARAQSKATELPVLANRRDPRVLGPSTVGPPAIVLHVPEPITGVAESMGTEGVAEAAGPGAREAAPVAADLDPALETGRGDRFAQVGDGVRELLPSHRRHHAPPIWAGRTPARVLLQHPIRISSIEKP